MQRSRVEFAVLTLTLLLSPSLLTAQQPGVVSGTVRDARGVSQMGALVEILAKNSSLVGTTFTDLHGRYVVANLDPGKYEVRASAALFVPATRNDLLVRAGSRVMVNLTLSTLFDQSAWIPAERRKADEPSDDWKWTLRSTANRPVLRMQEDGDIIMVSSSATEAKHPATSGKTGVRAGDQSFGNGGLHNLIVLHTVRDDGSLVGFESDIASAQGGSSPRVASRAEATYERRIGFAGEAKTVIGMQSHPEFLTSGYGGGENSMHVASATRTKLFDAIDMEYGGNLQAVRAGAYAISATPFVRMAVHAGPVGTIGYRMATSRTTQGYDDIAQNQDEVPAAIWMAGHLQMEEGRHQEVSAGHSVGKGAVQVSYLHDDLRRMPIAGTGSRVSDGANFASGHADPGVMDGVVTDTSNGSFRFFGPAFTANGVRVVMTQPIADGLWLAVSYAKSTGLTSTAEHADLATFRNHLKEESGEAASIGLRGRVQRSGTVVRAVYRWQPEDMVTAIDPYGAFSDQEYLSFLLKQPIHLGSILPPGLEATVDVTNLLAQGYRSVVSPDGRTLYIAQAPRAIMAGISLNF